jgi:uncharacterized membrane protein YedE/YeeE
MLGKSDAFVRRAPKVLEMTVFTPVQSLLGGVLIGLSAVLLMALTGRIAGITGVLSGLLPPSPAQDWAWRAAFLVGMGLSPMAYGALVGEPVMIEVATSSGLLLLSGTIVGVGVTYGSGCTSGHGVCGLARMSPRSFVATLLFMTTAAATVFFVRHMLGG